MDRTFLRIQCLDMAVKAGAQGTDAIGLAEKMVEFIGGPAPIDPVESGQGALGAVGRGGWLANAANKHRLRG